MKLGCTLLLLLRVTAVFAADDRSSPASLLQDSYQASKSLDRENRAFFWVRLTDASSEIMPQSTEGWSLELFKLAFKLPVGWNRIATEKNALVPLARVNPLLAFRLLAKVEKPVPHDGQLTEDLRADASASIFLPYLKSGEPNALRNIRKRAQDIGTSGEYPYRAIGLVIDELFKSHAPQTAADDLFNDALSYYPPKGPFLDADPQFYELLQYSRFAVNESLFKNGLREFVARLQSTDSRQPRAFSAEVRTVDGVYTFDNQKLLVLFQIYPIVARVDRPLSIDLATKYPVLRHADTEIQRISASGVVGGTGDLSGSTIDKRARERLLLKRIQNLRDIDPVTALKDAELVETEPDRSNALASVIPPLAGADRILARDAYLELLQSVERLPEGKPKLGGLVASAKAACGSGYSDFCRDYTGQALDYGLQFFTTNPQSKNEPLIQKQIGFLELNDAAQLAAEHTPQQALARIKSVEDAGLRSYLLLAAAKGLNQREQNVTGLVSAGAHLKPTNNR